MLVSARDLVRQIPAEWQENVKHREELPYRAFLDQIRDPDRRSRIGSWFWAVQELPDLLDRWGGDLPPEQVHVITVPPSGGPSSDAVGAVQRRLRPRRSRPGPRGRARQPVDGGRRDHAAAPDQPGRQPRARARRLPLADPRGARPPDPVAPHRTPRLALPPDVHPWFAEVSATWIDEIERRGYDVVGDLDDLRGGPPVTQYVEPDDPDEPLVEDAALDAIRALLLEDARLGARERELQGRAERGLPGPGARATCGRRTAGARRPCAGCRRAVAAAGCSAATDGCADGARRRRSARSGTSRSRRRSCRRCLRRPAPGGRPLSRRACRPPW